MTDLYRKTEEFVRDSFTKINKENSIPHFLRTAFWIKELRPDADKMLLVAAVAHDIERAFRKKEMERFDDMDVEFRRLHAERGAQIIGNFLKQQGCADEFIYSIKELVLKHEVGGDDEQNLLKDADSISFFENNAKRFLNRTDEMGKDKIREKFDWMFNRITSEKAKEIAKGWHEEAIRQLDKI